MQVFAAGLLLKRGFVTDCGQAIKVGASEKTLGLRRDDFWRDICVHSFDRILGNLAYLVELGGRSCLGLLRIRCH